MTRSFSVFCLVACLTLNMPDAWAQSKTKPTPKSPPKSAKQAASIKKSATGAALIEALDDGNVPLALDLVKRGAPPNVTNDEKTATALGLAASLGNLELVKALVERGAQLNVTDPHTYQPLEMAEGHDIEAIMTLLVEKGASVKTREGEEFRRPPLVLAAALKSEPLVKLMLDKGAEINRASDSGITALAAAASTGKVSLMELLVAHGANAKDDTAALQHAVGGGSVATLDFLAKQGNILTSEKLPEGIYFIHIAAASGSVPMIERVLQDTKVDIDITDNDGVTPLMQAALARKLDAVDFFIKHKADVNALDNDFESVLEVASKTAFDQKVDNATTKRMLAMLQVAGARNAPLSLSRAASLGDKKQLEALLTKGNDPNEPDKFNAVPIYYALTKHRISKPEEMVAILLAKGANPNIKAPDGRSLVDVARDEMSEESMALLRQAGAETPELDLTEAVERDDMATVNTLLEKGIVPESGALIDAIEKSDMTLMTRLLDKGAKINTRSRLSAASAISEYDFPLHAAVGMGNITATKLLLERGADPNVHTEDNVVPLQKVFVADQKDTDTVDTLVRLLVEHGADVRGSARSHDETPFGHLVMVAAPKTLAYLLEKGALADINGTSDFQSPLTTAVRRGQPDVVRFLLDNGANPNPPGQLLKETVLMEAVQADDTPEQLEIVRLLVQHGVPVDATDELGQNALQVALKEGNLASIKILREAGSKKATIIPAAAMEQAIYKGDTDTALRLIREGLDISAKLPGGDLPLYEAALWGDAELVKALLDHNADPNQKGILGMPLHAAADNGNLGVVRMLLVHGAKVDANDGFRGTPLTRAVKEKHLDVMRLLLKAGADPTARATGNPGSPLYTAAGTGELQAIEILLKAGADPNVGNPLLADRPQSECESQG